MRITTEQLADAISRGFVMPDTPHTLDGFAEACYDGNSYADLKDCMTAEPDKTDMETWGIGKSEWRNAQRMAIENAMYWAAE